MNLLTLLGLRALSDIAGKPGPTQATRLAEPDLFLGNPASRAGFLPLIRLDFA